MKQPEFALLKDTSGKTLLHYAAAGGVQLESGYFANFVLPRTVGTQDARGVTALMLAAAAGHTRCVLVLKRFEARIVDLEGCSALMYAARFGRVQVVELLLEEEFYIKDKNGFLVTDYLEGNQTFLRKI